MPVELAMFHVGFRKSLHEIMSMRARFQQAEEKVIPE